MAKDYYKVLGITEEEKKLKGEEFEKALKKHFRTISLANHPDRQANKSEAEKKKAEDTFKEAAEAYEVLKDPKKREEYDNPHQHFEFNGSNFGGMDFDDILKGFGMDFGFSNKKRQDVQVKGSSIRIPFKLTLEEMHSGVTKKIRYKRFEVCDHCGGSGMTTESRKKTCRSCGGSGTVFSNGGFFHMSQTCPTCGGNGYVIENPCPHCQGHGIVQKTTEVEVEIPKGVLGGMSIMKSGLGNAPHHNKGTFGDLIIVVQEVKHDKFESNGNDLYFTLDIGVVDAILGTNITVETIDGKQLTAKIPQGTNHGHKMRFKGYGLPKYGSSSNGDMIGVVNVVMPKNISKEEKDILEMLKSKENFK